jgi:hypothetical protein
MDDWLNGSTIEDEIRFNDELSPTQKKLLIQQANLEFYSAALLMVLCFLAMGAFAILLKGWLVAIVDGAIFWGTAIAYTVLKDKKNSIALALSEEHRIQQETNSTIKKVRKQ